MSLSRPYDARKPNLAPEGLLDPTAIPQYAFDFPTVFISIDAEAYERDHSKVTEIGISSLDMLDLTAIPPGKLGTDWVSHIHSRHFMIKENLGLVNTDFISGGGKFERGKSEVVSLGEIGAIIQSCFESPYCHTLPEGADGFQKMMYKQQYQIRTAMYKQRKLVLVGHDTKQDINYFGKLGFPIDNNVFHEILDTSELYRALMHDSETLSLARLLANFDIAGWNLHNAGNDAFYTLQALLAIGVQSRTSSLGDRRVPQYLDDKVGKAKEAAEAAALKEEEEWTEAAKGNRDGGQLTYRLTATSLDGTAEQEEVPKKKSSRDKKRAELDEEVKEFGRPVAL